MQQQFNSYTNSNDYELISIVGEGSSAKVYKARCKPINELVAIKIINLEKINSGMDEILKEIKSLSQTYHPNIVHVYVTFVDASTLWIVMPLMEGSFSDIMKCSFVDGFKEDIIATILKNTLEALMYIHDQGLIHRDIKAANIMLNSKGNVLVGDFGVCGRLIENGERIHNRNTFVGTPCWMAPEVLEMDTGYDFKADIWSLGITAIELARGSAPNANLPAMKVIKLVMNGYTPRLEEDGEEEFSREFNDFVQQCLHRAPLERPTAKHLLEHPFLRKRARDAKHLVQAVIQRIPPFDDRCAQLSEQRRRANDKYGEKLKDHGGAEKGRGRDRDRDGAEKDREKPKRGWDFGDEKDTKADAAPDAAAAAANPFTMASGTAVEAKKAGALLSPSPSSSSNLQVHSSTVSSSSLAQSHITPSASAGALAASASTASAAAGAAAAVAGGGGESRQKKKFTVESESTPTE